MNISEKWCPLNFGKIKIIFLGWLLVLASVLGVTTYAGLESGLLMKDKSKAVETVASMGKALVKMFESEKLPANMKQPGVNVIITNNYSTSSSSSNSTSKTFVAPTQKPATTKPCYRYRVIHLDNSTSYLCYSYDDYSSLVNLGFKLSSAKSAYEFHLDGVADYQAEYDRTKSNIYLNAKESQAASAAREKEKIGSVTLQMQEIERRGY